MAKAEKENWASPGKYPEWAQRIRFSGDVRARYQGRFLIPRGTIQFSASISTLSTPGSPYDISEPILQLADLQHRPGPPPCPASRPARHGGRPVQRLHRRACGLRPATTARRSRPTRPLARAPAAISQIRVLARSRIRQISARGHDRDRSRPAGSTIRSVIRPIWSGTGILASTASPAQAKYEVSPVLRRSRWPARFRSSTPISMPGSMCDALPDRAKFAEPRQMAVRRPGRLHVSVSA